MTWKAPGAQTKSFPGPHSQPQSHSLTCHFFFLLHTSGVNQNRCSSSRSALQKTRGGVSRPPGTRKALTLFDQRNSTNFSMKQLLLYCSFCFFACFKVLCFRTAPASRNKNCSGWRRAFRFPNELTNAWMALASETKQPVFWKLPSYPTISACYCQRSCTVDTVSIFSEDLCKRRLLPLIHCAGHRLDIDGWKDTLPQTQFPIAEYGARSSI